MFSSKQALHVLLLLCWAVRQGLCDAASEAGSVSRTPYDYYAIAQRNKQLHVDREMALRVINRNLDSAPGSIKEKAEVPPLIPCPTHDVHQRLPAWAARSSPAPLPTLRSSLADGCSFPQTQTIARPFFAVGRSRDASVQPRKRQEEGEFPPHRGHGSCLGGGRDLCVGRHALSRHWKLRRQC